MMTEYSDGTKVHKDDFGGSNFPDGGYRMNDIFGDKDYFYNQPPSSSCTSIRLGDNTQEPFSRVHKDVWASTRRTVVCMGKCT